MLKTELILNCAFGLKAAEIRHMNIQSIPAKHMTQSRITFELPQDRVTVIEALIEARFEEEGYPVACFEIDENRAIWAVSVYCDPIQAEDVKSAIADALNTIKFDAAISIEDLPDENWVAKTLSELAPVRAGRFVVHGSHDAGCAKSNEHAILIDAGMAFGTGHHGTTAGCLAMIDRELKRKKIVQALDLGSGSGVLAIAIAKAARIPVLASDIDPIADEVATANAKINNVGGLIESITATGFNHRRFGDWAPFDLIVANILAGPLQALAHSLSTHLASGATVILSGLLPHQKARILAAYRAQGMAFEHAHYQNGWMTLVLKNMC